MNPEDAAEAFFFQSDVEALKQASAMRDLSPLEVRVLLLQALSAARSAELQVSEMKAQLGLDVALLDRNAAAVKQLFGDMEKPLKSELLQTPSWLRFWANAFLAMDHYYLRLAGTILDTEEPWLPALEFAARVMRRFSRDFSELLLASTPLRNALQQFKLAQQHLYSVSYITCRTTLGQNAVRQLFPAGLSAKQQLKKILQ